MPKATAESLWYLQNIGIRSAIWLIESERKRQIEMGQLVCLQAVMVLVDEITTCFVKYVSDRGARKEMQARIDSLMNSQPVQVDPRWAEINTKLQPDDCEK